MAMTASTAVKMMTLRQLEGNVRVSMSRNVAAGAAARMCGKQHYRTVTSGMVNAEPGM